MNPLICTILSILLLCQLDLVLSIGTPSTVTHGTPTLIAVDIDLRQTTTDIEYGYDQSIEAHILKAREPRLINNVTKDGQIVWTAQNNKYADALILQVDSDGNLNPTLHFPEVATPQPTAQPTQSPNLITVPMELQQSTTEVEYGYDHSSNTHILKARPPRLINAVTQNGQVVWRAQNNKFADAILVQVGPNGQLNANVHFPDPPATPAMTPSPPSATTPHLISLNMDLRQSTNEVEYSYDPSTETHTLKAKPPLLIKSIFRSGVEVWTVTNNRYPSAIIFKFDASGEPDVSVQYPDPSTLTTPPPVDKTNVLQSKLNNLMDEIKGMTKLYSGFRKHFPSFHSSVYDSLSTSLLSGFTSCLNNKYDSSSFLPTPSYEIDEIKKVMSKITSFSQKSLTEGIKFYTGDPNDYNKITELNNTKYSKKEEFDDINYVFIPSVKCTKVTFDGKEVWRKGDREIVEPKSVMFNKSDCQITVSDDEKGVVFQKQTDGTWNFFITSRYETVPYFNILSSSGSAPKSGIDLDIKNTDSTDDFFIFNTGKIVTYTPKGGKAFKLVKQGLTTIWETKISEEFATKVEVTNYDFEGMFEVSITSKGVTKKFVKDKVLNWTFVDTSKKTGLGVTITSEHESYYYSNNFSGNTRTFIAKEGFIFNSLNEVDYEIWKSVSLEDFAFKFEVTNYDSEGIIGVLIYSDDGSVKQFVKDTSNQWKLIDPSNKTAMSVNIMSEIDSYFYSISKNYNIFTFTPSDGFIFNSVKQDSTEFWNTNNENEFSNKIELTKYKSDGMYDVIIHVGDGTKKKFVKDSNIGWTLADHNNKRPVPVNINYTNYTYYCVNKLNNNVRTFTSSYGFIFNQVKFDETIIWKAEDESEFANKVEMTRYDIDGMFEVMIHLGDGTKKKCVKSQNIQWTFVDTSKKNGLELNIKSEHDTFYFLINKSGNTKIFTPKDEFLFNSLKEDSTEFWITNNENEYSTKVELTKYKSDGMYDVIIHLGNGTIKKFVKDPKISWTLVNPSKIMPSSLNILSEHETFSYSNNLVGSERTFEVKDGFCFNKVIELNVNNKLTELWKGDDNEFSKKVVLIDPKSHSKTVNIHFQNNIIKSFIKVNNKWIDQTMGSFITSSSIQPGYSDVGKSSTTTHISHLHLFIKDRLDHTKNIELDQTKFKPNSGDSKKLYNYTFETGVRCDVVKFGDEIVWKHKDTSTPYPMAVSWHEKYKIVFLKFDDNKFNFYRKTSKKWQLIELQNVSVLKQNDFKLFYKEGNKSKKMDSTKFSFKYSGFAYEFEFNKGFNCEELKYDNYSFYKYDKNQKADYPSVIYFYSDKSGHIMYENDSTYIIPPSFVN